MKNILVVDSSDYSHDITDIYRRNGYQVMNCENAFDAMSRLKAYDFDLVVSEIELPGDNSFALYNYMQDKYPYIPTIMTTSREIDTYFENIFREGIGNVLHKPLKENELLNLSEKLITKQNIFGISSYLGNCRDMKRIRIQSSGQVTRAIEAITKQIADWGFPMNNRMAMNLVLNEMAINALYHSHGLTAEKLERKPVHLGDDQFVDLIFARNDSRYGISITDYNGRLTRARILESINHVITQEALILQAAETGEDITELVSETGRGIDLVRKLSGEYYFIIRKDRRTEIVILFGPDDSIDSARSNSSLKIIEDIDT